MKYFSGFGFQQESSLFEPYFDQCTRFSVVGFSYGAIEAFEYALSCETRIDRLILLSPAFFQYHQEDFKANQLLLFKRKPLMYAKSFYDNVLFPSHEDISLYHAPLEIEPLKKLLYYQWSEEKLHSLRHQGIALDVYVGSDDKICHSDEIISFFCRYATVYTLSGKGHLLK